MVEELPVKSIDRALKRYRDCPSPSEGSSANPFRLVSTVADPESFEGLEGVGAIGELRELWASCRSGRLFEDVDYGQWGLVLLDPESSFARTRNE